MPHPMPRTPRVRKPPANVVARQIGAAIGKQFNG